MTYISFYFYAFVAMIVILYYILPCRYRWIALLTGNIAFYMFFYKVGWWIFLITIVVSYSAAMLISKLAGNAKKMILVLAITFVVVPWLAVKSGDMILHEILQNDTVSWIVPMGISFYTLQIISYLIDVYSGHCQVQSNLAKYALFISFFPQIMQGPIPRYNQLGKQLIEGHLFDEDKFTKGLYLIVWGFFLKLVVADKAAVVVNAVFDNYPAYSGLYIWIAGFLYSIQLYADFLACTTLAQGVSKLFGIDLIDNFSRPYFATSIKDFWRRWHISLSNWLRDYIYIPLGGNRKGKLRKYINLIITFLISGMWHGTGIKFMVWGGLHALYQILEELLYIPKKKICSCIGIYYESKFMRGMKQAVTFLLVMFAWIIFRADTLYIGLSMIKQMLTKFNPWILFNDRIFSLGLDWKECIVLVLAIIIFITISRKQEKGIRICDVIMKQRLPVRWSICIIAILVIMVFGTYGYGFSVQEFIYRGF